MNSDGIPFYWSIVLVIGLSLAPLTQLSLSLSPGARAVILERNNWLEGSIVGFLWAICFLSSWEIINFISIILKAPTILTDLWIGLTIGIYGIIYCAAGSWLAEDARICQKEHSR